MPFQLTLHQPEIPNNTGNIGRTCIATGCALHLIRPFGFDTSVKALRRAGLDYWPRLAPTEHDDWEAYLRWLGSLSRDGANSTPESADRALNNDSESRSTNGSESRSTLSPRMWLYTTKCARPHWDVEIRPGDHLVFGKETAGLPDALLERHPDRLVSLPMVAGERSLNVATAVCAAIYEGMRQCAARGELVIGDDGRSISP
ncbi:MAG: tRNA (cytidine(34)-2'-O)-methyltransferase [Phycisphaeraceae bacterium]|nr:MAG: tRNA (cytidine(34)-2'-O)-methyltransferase [Phycisphaeraceae bacterium]